MGKREEDDDDEEKKKKKKGFVVTPTTLYLTGRQQRVEQKRLRIDGLDPCVYACVYIYTKSITNPNK